MYCEVLINLFPIFRELKISSINNYTPGRAINTGISKSEGEYIVILSGHCIPTSDDWLSNLIEGLDDPDIAGVYGRQLPMSFSSAQDKRDLLITFGLDKRIQIKDSFFHNANCAIKREILNKIPFNEEVSNIEDRVWGKQVIEAGYKIHKKL